MTHDKFPEELSKDAKLEYFLWYQIYNFLISNLKRYV